MSTPDDPQDTDDTPPPRKGAVKLSTFALQAEAVPEAAHAAGPLRSHGARSVITSLSGKLRPSDLMEETAQAAAAWRAKIVTLFPESFPGVLGLSLTGKALDNGLWALETIDLRPFGIGKHRNVDDTPAGGGAGMVLRADVVAAALDEAALGAPASREDWPVVYMSPRGKPFTQADARRFAAAQGMTILCGRFEGVDERVLEAYGVEEVSIGDFVLTGGELAAQVVIDATVRLRDGVLGNAESATEESHSNGLLEHPQYTRPAEWQGRTIPEVLTSGNHKKIAQWRREMSEALTRERRPDLWERFCDAPKG
ncbi:tRNA (guanine37-N(1)-) methyltransferase [Rhodobacter aestuarii]|uniref:tRNA (guanine-N(1)-)-methyltransferase n=2 Tax=Rhodobacter aestuarii TaxID=453582 RepID=A0A1N7Q9B5_9RHOB|nr:tRNA (guanosine(37)-N1)-methyltransferase TrmD [Rhodobacter aestuarii]PTV93775.1 tRNA (guanine37-N(1)-) methyltransferase [Rhodobacter aestuarii]SIT19450.1 tRNA (Guanine37-N(1)-) methyltransferase [Rhodobacter aestuarii]